LFAQILVEAYDSAFPDDTASVVVTVYINRNVYPPSFTLNAYSFGINDYDPAGTFVGQVSATDRDAQVSVSVMVGDVEHTFFFLEK
jgi:hypothetical protein